MESPVDQLRVADDAMTSPYDHPDLYDLEYEDHDEDVQAYVACARAAQNGPVLELGCGTGRLTIPMAKAGCRVVGVDNSRTMLDRLHAKLEQQPPDVVERVRTVHARAQNVQPDVQPVCIVWPFNAIHHCPNLEDLTATLAHLHGLSPAHGSLWLDGFLPAFAIPNERPTDPHDPRLSANPQGGPPIRSWERSWFDPTSSQLHVETTYARRTERHTTALVLQLFTRGELHRAITQSGWTLDAENGGFEGQPVDERRPKWVAKLTKRTG